MNAEGIKRVTILSAISSACTLYSGRDVDLETVLAAAEIFYAQAMAAGDQLAEFRAEHEEVLSGT